MKSLILVAALLLAGLTVLWIKPWGKRPMPVAANQVHVIPDDDEDPDPRLVVKTIYPKLDPSFVRSITAPAYVEPYFRADLYSHVAGPVKFIQKNIGDQVQAGELLVEIDIPDVIQDIAQKDALVQQAKADHLAAEAKVQTLIEAVETARTHIPEKQAALEQVAATRGLRMAELVRFRKLAEKNAITPDIVEERERDVAAANASVKTAELAIETARSELRGVQAKLEEARADLNVKNSRIMVAQKDKEKIIAQADWAKIRAPFAGVITNRTVDPGSFVQNATTAKTLPMLTLMRCDMVTVVMMVPERSAGFVKAGADVSIYVEVEPGKNVKNLKGTVTRFSPYLDPEKGRTLRAEVDLYNPPELGFKKSCAKGSSAYLFPMAAVNSLQLPPLWLAGQKMISRPGLLRPGMYGSITLFLEKFRNPYLVPSSAVFSQRGKTYVYKVQDGVAHRVPVQVQLEDGVRSKIAILVQEANPETGEGEVLEELTGAEEFIRSGQGEIADNQEVRTNRVDW